MLFQAADELSLLLEGLGLEQGEFLEGLLRILRVLPEPFLREAAFRVYVRDAAPVPYALYRGEEAEVGLACPRASIEVGHGLGLQPGYYGAQRLGKGNMARRWLEGRRSALPA